MEEQPIRCIIVDDEPLSVSLLESYVSNCPNTILLEKFTNPFDALGYIETTEPDVILLDVQMPELNGIQLMKIMQKKYPIVLTTAYPDYAINAFDLDVVDYLLKPISYERFQQAIHKVKEKLLANQNKTESRVTPNYFYIKSEYKIIKILFDDVYFFEGLRDYVAIHTKEKKILTLQSMKSFEESLPGDKFIRVHKSYIIHADKITGRQSSTLFLEKITIPIGAAYAQNVKAKLKIG